MTLRAGLIGLGMMGRHHARVLRQLDGVELIGAADPNGDSHRAVAGLPVVDTVERLLDLRPDYCVVATPTTTHAGIGSVLAAAGIAALIEKPLADNLPDAINLADAFAGTSTPAAVGHVERYNPAVQALRSHLAAQALGRIYQIATRRQGPFPPRVADVGVVFDLTTHDIDLVRYVTGRSVRTVAARTTATGGHRHEDLVVAICELDNGLISTHLVNWLSPMKERVTTVTGERGCLIADTLHGDLTYVANGNTPSQWQAAEVFRGVTEGDMIRYAIAKKEPLLAQHEAFRDHLLGRPANVVSLAEGVATVAVADAMIRSARAGATSIPLADHAYLVSDTPSSR